MVRRLSAHCTALSVAALGGALAVLAPRPRQASATLLHPSQAIDATAPVLAAVVLLVWALAGYLAYGAVLVAAGRVPGVLGRSASWVARRTVPRAVRRSLEVAVGASLVLGTVGALPASASTTAGGAGAATAVSLDWPTLSSPDAVQQVPTPAATPVTVAAPTATAGTPVVVQAGDTLWSLAERSLRDSGGAAPSDAAVATAWPSWWSANREVIGDDPDLIRPGTRLVAPPAP